MEEERRLCYVAITRAEQHLTITSARQRMLYGHTTVNRPSRFLKEIPEELLLEKSAAAPEFFKGDMVVHDVFGRGMVLNVLKMGNDAMLEIAFDQVGTKRLMAGAASTRMKKQA